ncbi:MAG: glycosyltransferase [Halothiobacillus sp.]|jgi:glycosyltransferase involved in cell wall biosynthesis|nr:glycosyltransferase [Halothiobacillus sp.]
MTDKSIPENSRVESRSEGTTNCTNTNLSDCSIRVVAITGGENVPSRRFRIDALVRFLAKRSIELTELCPLINKYPPSSRLLRLPWLAAALLERLTFLYRSRGYDAVILQREMISTLPTMERLLPKPLILDVDDAIYLHRNGWAAEYVARSCSLVVCGNHYLAEKFSQWNSNVVVIPTGVDTDQLRPIENRNVTEAPTIGWIGTAGNYRYLELIEPALRKVLTCFPSARLQIISNQYPTFLKHLGEQLDFRLWHPGIENDLLPRFTIGIMPLADNEWERGKCSFKMLQYLAAGVPVVVSPVGMNEIVLEAAQVGYAASSIQDWVDALICLLDNIDLASALGANGRKLVEKEYSLKQVAHQWRLALLDLLGG